MVGSKILSFLFRRSGYFLFFLLISFFITLVIGSWTSLRDSPFKSVFSTDWDPNKGFFGMLPFVTGTLLTTVLSALIIIPFSLSLSIVLGEFFASSKVAVLFQSFLEILAGIPTVIMGFWGAMFVVPLVQKILLWLLHLFPWLKNISFLGLDNYSGFNVFSASLLVALIILPFCASLGKEAVGNVSNNLKEASYALGATRYEVLRFVIIPEAFAGIFAGFLLSIGRALGETMAVTLVIGNRNVIPNGLFSPGQTISSLIANEFAESTEALHTSSIIYLALILFVITTVINLAGRYIIHRHRRGV